MPVVASSGLMTQPDLGLHHDATQQYGLHKQDILKTRSELYRVLLSVRLSDAIVGAQRAYCVLDLSLFLANFYFFVYKYSSSS